MQVIFYSNNADNRKVDKTNDLTLITTLNDVKFKMDENRGEPQLELAYDADVVHSNYCYIPSLGYYYYLTEPILSTQRIIFNSSTDLLMTYKDEILQLDCIIARQEEKFNAYLNDDRYPVKAKQDVTTLLFPSGFSDTHQEIIIAVNGGGGI